MSGTPSEEGNLAELRRNADANDYVQAAVFELAGEEYAIDILRVKEIIRVSSITRAPNAPYYFEGAINLRGKVVAVINLRKKFGLPPIELDKKSRIIVVEIDSRTVGFLVDKVSEVIALDKNTFLDPENYAKGENAKYISAIAKLKNRAIIALDLEKILEADRDK